MRKLLIFLISIFISSSVAFANNNVDNMLDFFELDSSGNYLPVQSAPDLGSTARPMGDIYAGALNVSGITLTGDMLLEDDINLLFGDGSDYWQVYNSTGTQFELWSTDVDGGGTDGLIISVDDGTDDVDFTGGATFGDNVIHSGYLLGNASGNTSVNIGTGTASSMTPTTEDLFVSGQLEVDGITWFDGSVNFLGIGMRFYDNGELQFGSLGDNRIDHSTAQTVDSLVMGLDQVARTLIITEHDDRNTDFGHSAQTNPAIFIQSADATNPSQYLYLANDQTDSVISSGTGSLKLAGVENTNNENVVFDFESTANVVEMSSTSGASISIPNLISGKMTFTEDGGIVDGFDMPVSSSSNDGDDMGYNMNIDNLPVFTVAGDSDGAGSVDGFYTKTSNENGASTNNKFAVSEQTSVSGASVTISNLIPDGAWVVGVSTRITTALGTTNGTTSYTVGDGSDADRWGDSGAVTLGTTTNNTDATADATGMFTSANDVVLTAVGGNFDGDGDIRVVVHYIDITAPTN